MSTVFVSAWLGSGNAGDELIFQALSGALRDRGHDVVTASLDPDETGRLHAVDAIPHLDLREVSRRIRRSDALVLGGGGLLQDDTSLLSPPYQLHRPIIARAARVPVAGIGLGVGTLRAPSRWLVARALAHAAPLVVRDEPSRRRLAALGLDQATTGADLVFTLPRPTAPPTDELAVVVRPTFAPRGLLPGRSLTVEPGADRRLASLARSLDAAAAAHDLRLTLVAMEPHRDVPHLEELARRLETPHEIATPGLDALEVVGRARAVVASRYHGVVAAVHAARPVVALGYADKVVALGEEAPGVIRSVPHDADGAAAVAGELERALAVPVERREELRQGLTDRARASLDALDALP